MDQRVYPPLISIRCGFDRWIECKVKRVLSFCGERPYAYAKATFFSKGEEGDDDEKSRWVPIVVDVLLTWTVEMSCVGPVEVFIVKDLPLVNNLQIIGG